MCLFLPFVFLFLVVGFGLWVFGCGFYCLSHYKTKKPQPKTHNQRKKTKGRNRHIPPFAFYLI